MNTSNKWNIVVGDYGFLVTANSEKTARKAAREWLKVKRLPAGTKVWQIPSHPWREEGNK